MNICFLDGKVITEPIYKFFYRENMVSICYFKLQCKKLEITIFGIDEVADSLFRDIKVNQLYCFYGSIRNTINRTVTLETMDYEKLSPLHKRIGDNN